jgi:monoamine oxidase
MASPTKHSPNQALSPSDFIKNVDVVIVGAGLSGLSAALDVQKAGLTVAVLEARDCVGGKTLSKGLTSGNGHVDVGAAWLNDKTQPKIYALGKKYGFDTVVQPTEGDEVLRDTSGKSQRVPEDVAPWVRGPCSSGL